MSTWRDRYKSMTAEQLSAEYQILLSKRRHDTELGDKLKFLKTEFSSRVKNNGLV